MKRSLVLLLLPLGSLLSAGCTTCQVQIWANSASDDPNLGSPANPHYFHVGETAQFRVYVQPDIATYVLAEFDGQTAILTKVNPGEYSLTRRFDERWRDRPFTIDIRAWKQEGKPDVLIEGGIVRKLPAGNDPPDVVLGQTQAQIVCYQSKLIMKITPTDKKEPDWSKAKLQIFGLGDKISEVKLGQPGADGFAAIGQDAWGAYTIFYEPRLDQIRRAGRTKAVLIYLDGQNREQKLETYFDTP